MRCIRLKCKLERTDDDTLTSKVAHWASRRRKGWHFQVDKFISEIDASDVVTNVLISVKDLKNTDENCEMIWKIWMKCEMIWIIWKKSKLKSEKRRRKGWHFQVDKFISEIDASDVVTNVLISVKQATRIIHNKLTTFLYFRSEFICKRFK
jgi:hypothetical protein